MDKVQKSRSFNFNLPLSEPFRKDSHDAHRMKVYCRTKCHGEPGMFPRTSLNFYMYISFFGIVCGNLKSESRSSIV
jgi:hypothetical protein